MISHLSGLFRIAPLPVGVALRSASDLGFRIFRIAAILLALAFPALAQDKPKPLRALMVCGGCCHDYKAQKIILSEGITARANVEWTIVHEDAPKGTNEKLHRVSIYEKPNWAEGYDIVLHNECFGAVEDVAFVESIAAPHKGGRARGDAALFVAQLSRGEDRRVADVRRHHLDEP